MKLEEAGSEGRQRDEESHDVLINGSDVLSMVGNFFSLSFTSMAMGIAMGLICSRILRDVNMNYDSVKEAIIIMLFAYLAYLVAEEIHLSGIISMFTSGLVLAHYAYWNIN